jgi:hypothetical protein
MDPLTAMAGKKIFLLENQKAFYLAASHRQIKNNFWASFLPAGRQVRLCGENLILEKSLNAS